MEDRLAGSRHVSWRNGNSHDRHLCKIVDRTNVADTALAACTACELCVRSRDEAAGYRVADPTQRKETGNVEIRVELERETGALPGPQSPDDVELRAPANLDELDGRRWFDRDRHQQIEVLR